jgi:hypothetical protein
MGERFWFKESNRHPIEWKLIIIGFWRWRRI